MQIKSNEQRVFGYNNVIDSWYFSSVFRDICCFLVLKNRLNLVWSSEQISFMDRKTFKKRFDIGRKYHLNYLQNSFFFRFHLINRRFISHNSDASYHFHVNGFIFNLMADHFTMKLSPFFSQPFSFLAFYPFNVYQQEKKMFKKKKQFLFVSKSFC